MKLLMIIKPRNMIDKSGNIEKNFPNHFYFFIFDFFRLWGMHGQKRIEKAHICLLGAGPSGTETLKNLILPGNFLLPIFFAYVKTIRLRIFY